MEYSYWDCLYLHVHNKSCWRCFYISFISKFTWRIKSIFIIVELRQRGETYSNSHSWLWFPCFNSFSIKWLVISLWEWFFQAVYTKRMYMYMYMYSINKIFFSSWTAFFSMKQVLFYEWIFMQSCPDLFNNFNHNWIRCRTCSIDKQVMYRFHDKHLQNQKYMCIQYMYVHCM